MQGGNVMEEFAQLLQNLQSTLDRKTKVSQCVRFFLNVQDADAAAAIYLLVGRRPKRVLSPEQFRFLLSQRTGLPDWLILESKEHVGELAETYQLIWENNSESSNTPSSLAEVFEKIIELNDQSVTEDFDNLAKLLNSVDPTSRLLLIKLLIGTFRYKANEPLLFEALAEVYGQTPEVIATCLLGDWAPNPELVDTLRKADPFENTVTARPFSLAAQWEEQLESKEQLEDYQIEWLWDGLRVQILWDGSDSLIWSREGSFLTEHFPELALSARSLDQACIVDGMIIAGDQTAPQSYGYLLQRLGKSKVDGKTTSPIQVSFIAFDLLHLGDQDLRKKPLSERISALESLLKTPPPHFEKSECLQVSSWDELENLKHKIDDKAVNGFIIKRLGGEYLTKRQSSTWWKLRKPPRTCKLMLTAAEKATNESLPDTMSLIFSAKSRGEYLTVARCQKRLARDELQDWNKWLRKNTITNYGAQRTVKAERVFEISFEGVLPSTRSKSGIELRSAEIIRELDHPEKTEVSQLNDLKHDLDSKPDHNDPQSSASSSQTELGI